jgi:hypothetical protein
VHTAGYELKADPFHRYVERVLEGISVVHVPDFVHDSYDAERASHYNDFKRREGSLHEAHCKDLHDVHK